MADRNVLFVAIVVLLPTAALIALLLSLRLRWKHVALMGLACLALLVSFHALTLDGLDGLVFKLVTPDDTQLAARYSAIGFWRVREGMTPAAVERLVGPPLEKYKVVGGTGWRWSRSAHDSNYRVRVVIFVTGRVAEKFSEFYVD